MFAFTWTSQEVLVFDLLLSINLWFFIYSLEVIPKPNSVSVTKITLSTAKLHWELVPGNEETYGNIDGYKIFISHDWVVNMTTVSDMTSILLRNISSNATYCFVVVAFNRYGDGINSDIECFMTLGMIGICIIGNKCLQNEHDECLAIFILC